ncbi:MAG: triosephosphate isomerase [Candidatus Midichloriaceae bacterium]|jgi:triosephosphate isomerase
MKRKKILIANWKNYIQDLNTINNKISDIHELVHDLCDIVICPPTIYLQKVLENIKNSNIKIGVQNFSLIDAGASTGEITLKSVADMGCDYAIIGHSEVRECNNEDNYMVRGKVEFALKYNITPIICIGENLDTRKHEDYLKFLIDQVIESLPSLEEYNGREIFIAYEPIWCIGSGIIPSAEQIEEIISTLKLIPNQFTVKFLYGGSVNEKNIQELNKINSLDGFLVGGASIDINKLLLMHKSITT